MTDDANHGTAQKRVRRLTGGDLERCIAIDRAHAGRSRRGFFEARLRAALKDPARFIYVGVDDADGGAGLAGFALVRLLEGEYGGTERIAVLDAIGVDGKLHGHGHGRALMRGAEEVMRDKGVVELRSQLDWNNHALTRFLDAAGFELAPRVVLSRAVAGPVDSPLDPIPGSDAPRSDAGVPDYSDPNGGDFDALSRDKVPARSLIASDLAALTRIDRKITGRDRGAYFAAKTAEVLEETGIRISLVAELDGHPVGFVMARLDVGEFGHFEPEAVIDTIGVDPDYAHRHVGGALMSQLLVNLGALRVDHVRTQLGWDQLDLLRYLENHGFRPSQRIALARRIG